MSQTQSATYLLNQNSYSDDIGQEGVLARLLVVATRISHDDGSDDVWCLSAPDGSSRIVSCHHNLGISTRDVTYRYALDVRAARGLVGDLASDLEKQTAIRSLTVPVMLVVGTEESDVRRAVQGYTGMQHVSHPTEWTKIGRYEARGEAALDEMVASGLPELTAEWFKGTLRPQQAADAGWSARFDDRSVLVLSTFRDRQYDANRGLRRVDNKSPKGAVAFKQLAAIAADMALRPVRKPVVSLRDVSDSDIAREQLAELYAAVWRWDWSLTGASPEDLRDAALDEIETGQPGPNATELLLLGAYHAVRLRVVAPVYYHEWKERVEKKKPAERRPVSQVLMAMTTTTTGISQLAQLVIDARQELPPRRVTADGALMKTSTGDVVALKSDDVRYEIAPDPAAQNALSSPPVAGVAVHSPDEELIAGQVDATRRAAALHSAIAELRKIKREGDPLPLIDDTGWPPVSGQELVVQLDEVRSDVAYWMRQAGRNSLATETVRSGETA